MKMAIEENWIQSLNSSVDVLKTGRRRRVWKKRKEAMKPKICDDSLMRSDFTQEEIDELKKRLDEVKDVYDRNLEKGISYDLDKFTAFLEKWKR